MLLGILSLVAGVLDRFAVAVVAAAGFLALDLAVLSGWVAGFPPDLTAQSTALALAEVAMVAGTGFIVGAMLRAGVRLLAGIAQRGATCAATLSRLAHRARSKD
ncbi:MAG: hypothetical protein AAGB11_19045 [Pseudomonadota bacterium]